MSVIAFKELLDDKSEITEFNGALTIKEIDNKNNKGKLKEVIITNLDNQTLCSHKLDCYNPITKYLSKKNTKGINRGVDAFLLLENEPNQKHILFFELKSFKVKESEVANKFFASTSFLHHTNHLLEKFYNVNISSYNAAAILFSLKNSNNRLVKFGMRPDIPIFECKNYKNSIGKSIQVLVIQKNNALNFRVSIDEILLNCRAKPFKNWP